MIDNVLSILLVAIALPSIQWFLKRPKAVLRVVDQKNGSGLLTLELTNVGYRDTVIRPTVSSSIWAPTRQSLRPRRVLYDIREPNRICPGSC